MWHATTLLELVMGPNCFTQRYPCHQWCRNFDVLQGGVTERTFTLDVGYVSVDPDRDTIKVPLDFWRKEMGQLASEVRTHDG